MMKIEYADEPKQVGEHPRDVTPETLEYFKQYYGQAGIAAKGIDDEHWRQIVRMYEEAVNPKTLLSDGMVECAICRQSISIGCGYRNSDAGTVHDMESDCAANLAFVFDALEKAEAQLAEQTQLHRLEAARASQLLAPRVVLLEAQLATARQDAFVEYKQIIFDAIHKWESAPNQTVEYSVDFAQRCTGKANALKEVFALLHAAGQPIPKPPVQECQHEWVDARNDAIISGEWCRKCNAIRSGNATTQKPISTEAAQGCECENCRDERRAAPVVVTESDLLSGVRQHCPCVECQEYRKTK